MQKGCEHCQTLPASLFLHLMLLLVGVNPSAHGFKALCTACIQTNTAVRKLCLIAFNQRPDIAVHPAM